ncbi:hypothetical protein NPIL_421141 [Nephila pilipes]|uniref:Uncharacterized protein n=1 Tax=Nephila pilipes TaxID=299642 RepID=A0A8X6N3I1_NEPPI|nr:hypothetical protein NPIL_421141 [Nephila pilipes]
MVCDRYGVKLKLILHFFTLLLVISVSFTSGTETKYLTMWLVKISRSVYILKSIRSDMKTAQNINAQGYPFSWVSATDGLQGIRRRSDMDAPTLYLECFYSCIPANALEP